MLDDEDEPLCLLPIRLWELFWCMVLVRWLLMPDELPLMPDAGVVVLMLPDMPAVLPAEVGVCATAAPASANEAAATIATLIIETLLMRSFDPQQPNVPRIRLAP